MWIYTFLKGLNHPLKMLST